MGQRTIKYLSDKFSNEELIEAYDEIKTFHKTGILSDGHVRDFAEKINRSGIANEHVSLHLAEEEVLLRIAERFITMYKENEKRVQKS